MDLFGSSFKPGHLPSPRELQRIQIAANQSLLITVSPPLEVIRSGANGIHIRLADTTAAAVLAAVEMVRITGPWVKDNVARSPFASPLCYYPGIIQTCDAQNGWADTATAVWFVLWRYYNYATFPPLGMGLPYTAVLANGQGAHVAYDLGFTYNPGDPPGATLPVWGSDSYAADIDIQCITDGSGVPSQKGVPGG